VRKRGIEEGEVIHDGKRLKFNLDLVEHENPVLVLPLKSLVKMPKEFPEEVAPPEIKVSKVVYAGEKRVRKQVVKEVAPPAKKRKVGGAKRVSTPFKVGGGKSK
jgi:hypothetical protein